MTVNRVIVRKRCMVSPPGLWALVTSHRINALKWRFSDSPKTKPARFCGPVRCPVGLCP